MVGAKSWPQLSALGLGFRTGFFFVLVVGGFLHFCVLVSRCSSLEDARISQPKSFSRELEDCPIYGWRKAFLTTVSRLAPGQMPVWSPSLPAPSSSLSEMYEVIHGSTLLPPSDNATIFPLSS